MFFYRLGDFPEAFEAPGKGDHIAGAEGYGIAGSGIVGDGYGTFQNETGFTLVVLPVEFAGSAGPDGPCFTVGDIFIRRFTYNYIFYRGHDDLHIFYISFPKAQR